LNGAQRPAAPGLQFAIEQGGGAADLHGRQAVQAELGHDLGGIAGGHTLHIHLGNGQHHRAAGAPAPLQGLRVERLFSVPGLGHLDGQRAGRCVEGLGLVAVGIAPALGAALVPLGAKVTFPLQAHGEIEQGGEDLALGTGRDKLLQESSDDRALRFRHSSLL
jgi:hypothetical protein